jgi:cytosine/adenosine deaminase-related metal-dependent hydrolase
VNALLELNPDFIVHGNEMTDEDMEDIADAGIPVVICPRSNAFFGKSHRFGKKIY